MSTFKKSDFAADKMIVNKHLIFPVFQKLGYNMKTKSPSMVIKRHAGLMV